MSNNATTFFPPPAGLTPFSGTFGKKELTHLLRRTLFGATKEDLKHFDGKSLAQVVAELLTPKLPDATDVPQIYYNQPYKVDANGVATPSIDPASEYGTSWLGYNTSPSIEGQRILSFKAWWMGRIINQERSITEKMTLFWHNHFATEADTVQLARYIYKHNNLLRTNVLGNFRTLTKEVTIDQAMLKYLNGEKNTKAAPDENYGRELQELFTVGKSPNSKYTEDDVKAAAKVLTGWKNTIFQSEDYVDKKGNKIILSTSAAGVNTYYQKIISEGPEFLSTKHDTTDKQFSAFYGSKIIKGKTGADGTKELDEMLDMIFAQNEVSKFIARKLYVFFVYYDITQDVEDTVIAPLAKTIRDNNYEIKPALEALFSSAHFYDFNSVSCVIKSPVDYVATFYRQFKPYLLDDVNLGAEGKTEALYKHWLSAQQFAAAMQQDLGDPPNVAGWAAYYQTPQFHEMWVNTATMPKRDAVGKKAKNTNNLFNAISLNSIPKVTSGTTTANVKAKIMLDVIPFAEKLDNPGNPVALIQELVDLLLGMEVSQKFKDAVKKDVLLTGQSTDAYWTEIWDERETVPASKTQVNTRLQNLLVYFATLAEYHLS
jgi:uncharacterized protein (DUF1800 family)